MCILLNVKKHEKTFALNVDIFICFPGKGKLLTFELKNGNISFVATCSAGVAELADAHDSKSCG